MELGIEDAVGKKPKVIDAHFHLKLETKPISIYITTSILELETFHFQLNGNVNLYCD